MPLLAAGLGETASGRRLTRSAAEIPARWDTLSVLKPAVLVNYRTLRATLSRTRSENPFGSRSRRVAASEGIQTARWGCTDRRIPSKQTSRPCSLSLESVMVMLAHGRVVCAWQPTGRPFDPPACRLGWRGGRGRGRGGSGGEWRMRGMLHDELSRKQHHPSPDPLLRGSIMVGRR